MPSHTSNRLYSCDLLFGVLYRIEQYLVNGWCKGDRNAVIGYTCDCPTCQKSIFWYHQKSNCQIKQCKPSVKWVVYTVGSSMAYRMCLKSSIINRVGKFPRRFFFAYKKVLPFIMWVTEQQLLLFKSAVTSNLTLNYLNQWLRLSINVLHVQIMKRFNTKYVEYRRLKYNWKHLQKNYEDLSDTALRPLRKWTSSRKLI